MTNTTAVNPINNETPAQIIEELLQKKKTLMLLYSFIEQAAKDSANSKLLLEEISGLMGKEVK